VDGRRSFVAALLRMTACWGRLERAVSDRPYEVRRVVGALTERPRTVREAGPYRTRVILNAVKDLGGR